MDVREKLVELCEDLETLPCCATYEEQAEYLISHGVTVQEWISVDDRLPNPRKRVLIYSRHDFCESAFYIGGPGEWRVAWNHEMLDDDSVTHWMPLPKPPKGE